jgi:YD repeat-containing protein
VLAHAFQQRLRRGLSATRTDAVGAVASITPRDAMGNVLSVSDRKGQAKSYTYDPLNRPLTATFADGSTLSWAWDLGGRLTQVQDSVGGTIIRTYDDLDRLLTETTPQGMVSYTYDAAGRRLTMQAAAQAQVSYTYDNADRLIGISQGSTSLTFGYDAAGRRISAALPGGITAAYTWDAASQLTGITYASGTTIGDLTYGYDLAGHVVARGGSLFQSVLPTAVTSASYDLANRLTARTAAGITASPMWDANGNLTSDGVRSYIWDARDRLTSIVGVANFVYDAFGRRQMATRGGTSTAFLYDSWDVVQEQQAAAASADLLIGLDVDERFARNGATFLTGALGSTMALANAGTVATNYGYDPYGVSQVTGAASDNSYLLPAARMTALAWLITVLATIIQLGVASSLKIQLDWMVATSISIAMLPITPCSLMIPVAI